MAEKKKRKKASTKRFGPRYGRRIKEKLADVEKAHLGKQKCPFCSKNSVKRVAVGIWHCKSCKRKFAGRAYNIGKSHEKVEESVNKETKKSAAEVSA